MQRDSQLYARYNGSMLGFFHAGAFAADTGERYPVLRERMAEFLDELGIRVELPETHGEFVDTHSVTWTEIATAVLAASPLVGDFFMLGSLSMHHAVAQHDDAELAAALREQAVEWLAKYELPAEALDRFAAAVAMREDGSIGLDTLHTPSLTFLRGVIQPIPVEEDTAFVAMSFTEPFRSNFPTLYAPVLEQVGYRAIRAWGGLDTEDYQELLITLISKCGALLADLTTLNDNVLHEFGVADGQDKLVFAIAEKGKVVPPSNLADMAIFEYERGGEGWQQEAVPLLAMMLAMGKLGLELGDDGETSPGNR